MINNKRTLSNFTVCGPYESRYIEQQFVTKYQKKSIQIHVLFDFFLVGLEQIFGDPVVIIQIT